MAIHTSTRTFDRDNIKPFIRQYRAAIRTVGDSIEGLRGIRLLHALKRTQRDFGIYTDVTLFEAANRIMSDLVILHGVKFLLENRAVFPFDSYTVELGNEDRNGFDIRASADGRTLVGEGFNVAVSFFSTKNRHALKKMRSKATAATYRIVVANADAVTESYRPDLTDNEYFLAVNVYKGRARLIPGRQDASAQPVSTPTP